MIFITDETTIGAVSARNIFPPKYLILISSTFVNSANSLSEKPDSGPVIIVIKLFSISF